ncbi:MAG: hypothetical protein IJS56_03430 [Bacilli bacterium]|nr:hypothetical protein [Bacilli bacterium]
MNNRYLIPANTKRSMLIFGLFKPVDIIIFVIGGSLTAILIAALGTDTPAQVLVGLAPLLISVVMLSPVPNHRNFWTFTVNVYTYFTSQRKYRWRGWCMLRGEDKEQ